MKISNETLQIIKNYATINTNILFREGNSIATISAGKSIFAKATVPENFPKEVAIYDLNSLLALLSITGDQDIEFGDSSMTISSESGQFEYFYANPNVLAPKYAEWPVKTPTSEGFYTFELSHEQVHMITKSVSILGAQMISIIGDGENATLIVGDPKTPSTNAYRKQLGKCDRTFNAHLNIENFKIISGDYSVVISDKSFIHFKNKNKDLGYWFALDRESNLGS